MVVTKAPARVKSSALNGSPQLHKEALGEVASRLVDTGAKSQPIALGPTALRLIEEEKRWGGYLSGAPYIIRLLSPSTSRQRCTGHQVAAPKLNESCFEGA